MGVKKTRGDGDGYKAANRRKSRRGGKAPLSRKQAAAVKSLAKSVIHDTAEKMFVDTRSTITLSAVPSAINMSAISQGDTDNANRTGDKVQPDYLSVRYTIVGNTSSLNKWDGCRVIFFQWKQNVGDAGAPDPGDILADSDGWLSHYNKTRGGTFKILYDMRVAVTNAQANPDFVFKDEFTIPRKKLLPIEFNDGNTTGLNTLYMLPLVSSVDASRPSLEYEVRLGYTDI